MENDKVTILDCPIDNITMDQTLSIVKDAILKRKNIKHVVVNAAKLIHMQKNRDLYNAVVASDLINADGQAVVWASKILNKPICERVTGIDLMQNIVEMAHENNFKIYFLGASDEVINKVIEEYSIAYSDKIIAGYHNGYFNENEELKIAEEIKTSEPDVLFIAITSPKKELFLEKYKDYLDIPFIMGVGGSFDVVAGKTKRAPKWMQKNGLEWFYRVIQEPGRMWKRYLTTNTLFIYEIFKLKILKKG